MGISLDKCCSNEHQNNFYLPQEDFQNIPTHKQLKLGPHNNDNAYESRLLQIGVVETNPDDDKEDCES